MKSGLLLSLGFIGAAGLGVVTALADGFNLEASALVCALATTLAAPLIWRFASGTFDPFEPVVWFVIVWGLLFVIRPLVMYATGDSLLRETYDVTAGVLPALGLGLLGALAFVFSYESFVRRGRITSGASENGPSKSPQFEPPGWAPTLAVLALGLVGVLLNGGRVLSEAASDAAAYEYALPLLLVPGFILLLLRAEAGAKGALTAAIVVTIGSVGFFLIYGVRASVLLPVSAFAIFIYLSRRRRPSLALLGAVVVLFVLPMFSLLEYTRQTPERGFAAASQEADLAPGAVIERFAAGNTLEMFPSLALQLSTEGEVWQQEPGYEIYSVGTRPIPSALWSEKPLTSSEKLYSKYFPDNFAVNPASILFTLVGEFYYDSGIIGVVVGMVLAGLVFARAWRWLLSRLDDPWAWALFSPMFISAALVLRGDLAILWSLVIFVYAPLIGARWLAMRKARASSGLVAS